MRRRKFITLIAAASILGPVRAASQQGGKIWRIGHVTGSRSPSAERRVQALERHLAALGYVEGKNIALLHRFVASQREAREQAIAALTSEIDLLVVWSSLSAVAAKKVAPSVPIVFLAVGDPVALGLVQSLARPGGNMTGVTFEATHEAYGKRLQLLKEFKPDLQRAAVLGARDDSNVEPAVTALEKAAKQFGITLLLVEFGSADELEAAFTTITMGGAQGVVVVGGSLTEASSTRIAALALATKLPSSHVFSGAVQAGGLVSYGPDFAEMARQGATYLKKLMSGSSPSDLPVQLPNRYETSLNLRTAKALELAVPATVLASADEVIE